MYQLLVLASKLSILRKRIPGGDGGLCTGLLHFVDIVDSVSVNFAQYCIV